MVNSELLNALPNFEGLLENSLIKLVLNLRKRPPELGLKVALIEK